MSSLIGFTKNIIFVSLNLIKYALKGNCNVMKEILVQKILDKKCNNNN